MLLPKKEWEKILIGLEGTKPFPSEKITYILHDFKETTMPLSSNLRKLLLKVGTAEFITKPFPPLLELQSIDKRGVGLTLPNALSYPRESCRSTE